MHRAPVAFEKCSEASFSKCLFCCKQLAGLTIQGTREDMEDALIEYLAERDEQWLAEVRLLRICVLLGHLIRA